MPMPERETLDAEAALLARVRAGDQTALETIFRRYYAAVVGFANRYIDDRPLAEELVQDLFTQMWVERARWEVKGSVTSYLFAAARNRALNHRKRRALERDWSDSQSMAAQDDTIDLEWAGRFPVDPHALLESAELQGQLDRAIAALPERCRLVMHLRWREQLSYAEIAEVMGISVKGVENQLGRGLKALRELLPSLR